MFPRTQRLSRAAFGRASARSKRRTTDHFSLAFPSTGEGYAVVVSKAVAKSSVARHKLKRHILEALKRLPLPQSLIVYARKGSPAMTQRDIEAELRAGLA